MNNELIELCPICIESPVTYFTECNHGYCVGCLSRIKKCAMCRNPLQRAKICIQIKQQVKLIDPNINPLIFNNSEDFDRRVTTTINRNGDLITRTYLSVTFPEISERFSQREDSYFSLNPENYQPSGTANFSRIDNIVTLPIDSAYNNNISYESGRRLNQNSNRRIRNRHRISRRGTIIN